MLLSINTELHNTQPTDQLVLSKYCSVDIIHIDCYHNLQDLESTAEQNQRITMSGKGLSNSRISQVCLDSLQSSIFALIVHFLCLSCVACMTGNKVH